MPVSFSKPLLAIIILGWFSLHGVAQQAMQHDPYWDSFESQHNGAFPVYLAKYANGDWDYGNHLDAKGNIDGGSLQHLVTNMNEWSHGKMNGAAAWIDVGSPKFQSLASSIVVFTGSKDFTLTAQEVNNLRAYLKLGGTIWGDNAKGGSGSSFDLAFRREMKRLISDPNKKLEPAEPNEDIFRSWFDLTNPPIRTNLVELLYLDNATSMAISIIYTPNHLLDNSEPKEQLGMNIICRSMTRYFTAPGK